MMHKLISYYGFSRMPFGRDLAPGMLHRHSAHNEAVARIGCGASPTAASASSPAKSAPARPSPCAPH